MALTLAKVAAALGAAVEGEGGLPLARAVHPSDAAGPEDLALAMSPDLAALINPAVTRAALLAEGADWRALGLQGAALVRRPKAAMAPVTAMFAPEIPAPAGVHPSAVVDPSAVIGEGSSLGPFVWIGPGARIGARARILAGASVAEGAVIGEDALIFQGARVGPRVRIGHRFILHPNAVIGSDGFSFATPERGSVESAKETGAVAEGARNMAGWMRVFSLGGVLIGDDVEIGAGACVDRGTMRETVIGDGTKIDNQVQVGHNVRIGAHCLICAQAGIAGSSEIGDRCVLGGKAGVADHTRIGHDSVIAANSGVGTHVPPRSVMMGSPAWPREEAIRIFMAMRRLPRLMASLRAKPGAGGPEA